MVNEDDTHQNTQISPPTFLFVDVDLPNDTPMLNFDDLIGNDSEENNNVVSIQDIAIPNESSLNPNQQQIVDYKSDADSVMHSKVTDLPNDAADENV